jgi:hypothetical protein
MLTAVLRERRGSRKQKSETKRIHSPALLLITRRIVSKAHQAGLLTSGSKRSSSRLPIQHRTVAYSPREVMKSLPVTVARLRRIYTDFPLQPRHLVRVTW